MMVGDFQRFILHTDLITRILVRSVALTVFEHE